MVVTSIAFFLRFLFQLLLEFGQECRLCSPGFVANRSGLDSCERPRMDGKKGRWSSNDRIFNTWGCVFFLLDLSREWFFLLA